MAGGMRTLALASVPVAAMGKGCTRRVKRRECRAPACRAAGGPSLRWETSVVFFLFSFFPSGFFLVFYGVLGFFSKAEAHGLWQPPTMHPATWDPELRAAPGRESKHRAELWPRFFTGAVSLGAPGQPRGRRGSCFGASQRMDVLSGATSASSEGTCSSS